MGRDVIRVEVKGSRELVTRLKALGANVDRLLTEAVEAGAEVIRDEARRRAPGPEIELVMEREGARAEADIGPTREKFYYAFFETGSTPHTIRAKVRKALRFPGAEGEQFARVVEHPGMPARPFLRPAIDERGDDAVKAAGGVLRKGIDEVVGRRG